ncbi:MAG: Dihydrofolate reductase region [Gammaproteobacteria bacterium]|jgi:dihydrofolate reductase|nr:Dihydrofolate reductase region [Gammaproteobacteria bacterium]
MFISAIVAMAENYVIGKNNQLPWHLPADLKHFKTITMGKPILMGRKTYESIGKPLPGRCNIVITREKDYHASGCLLAHSIKEALETASESDEIFIIGGALLFQEMLPMTQRLYMTLIHQPFEGDTFFPKLNQKEWQEIERIDHSKEKENGYAYSFIKLERTSNLI